MEYEYDLCPKLVGSEEHPAMVIGHGNVTVPFFESCIGRKCAAFSNGFCYAFLEKRKVKHISHINQNGENK